VILRIIAACVLTLLLVLTGGAYWLLATPGGAGWLAREAQSWSGGALRLAGVRGTVLGGLEAEVLELDIGRTSVRVAEAGLRLRPGTLLGGRIRIETLHLASLDIAVAADPAARGEPFRMPVIATPVPVDVAALRIGQLRIRVDQTEVALRDIAFQGGLAGTRLTVRRLGVGAQRLGVGVHGYADLTPELPVQAQLAWRLAGSDLSGSGPVRGHLERIEVEQALRLPQAVRVVGSVTGLASEARVEAQASWSEWPLAIPGVGPLTIADGQLQLAGGTAAWNAALRATVQGPERRVMQLGARAHGDLDRIVFDELRAGGVAGELAARGVLRLRPAWSLQADVLASALDPAVVRPGLQGSLDGRVEVDAAEGGATSVRVRDLRGELMRRPLSGSGDIRIADDEVRFSRVVLQVGPNRLTADGVLGEQLAGQFALTAPQLGLFWPGLSGEMSARASIGGTRQRPVVDARAEGRDLVLGDNRLARMELDLRVDRRQRAQALLRALGLAAGNLLLGDLDARLEGSVESHRLSAALDGPDAIVTLASAGRWSGSALQHRLESGAVTSELLGDWQLEGEPQLRLAADAIDITAHCWRQRPATLCVDAASWSPGRSRMSAALRNFDLRQFNRWLAADVAIEGRAEADLDIVAEERGLSGSAAWRQAGTIVYYTGGDEPLVTPLETVSFSAALAPERSTASLEISGSGALRLQADASLAGPLQEATPLQGSLEGQLPDIAPLLPLFAGDLDVTNVTGRVIVDAAVGGTLRSPQITGTARLADGAAAFPGLGMRIEDINLALRGEGGESFRLEGSAQTGGLVSLEGEVAPLAAGGPRVRVRLRGERLEAVRMTDRYIQVSPDITLRYAEGRFAVDGEVQVPKAEIIVRALPETAASPSPDTVVMDRAEPETGPPPRQVIGGELALTLGRDVRLKAFGLDTLLEGTVKLSQGADGEAQGFGVVRLREGKFGAYGKELIIERGTLGFSGPLDNPAIDLRAGRRVEWEGRTVTAGIRVSGTALRPESRVYSDPAMSEADAISYLVSGRPMQSANASERSAIAGAALSLGVSQASPLTQKLGSAVTLDELAVEGSALDETEIIAGKRLNDDLYVRFAYGLFNRVGTVLARYRIARNVSIEAASGEDQSLDLIYSVETD